jgi:uncharacterized cupin superfamily protein
MSERLAGRVTVVDAHGPFAWEEVPRPPGDTSPPGYETVVYRSRDAAFSCGFWKRVPETGPLEPPFHEIMCLLQGEVEIARADGATLRVGPGDVLAAPHGSSALWRSLSPVYKFWAVHHGPVLGGAVTATRGDGDLPWSRSTVAADDGFPPGREVVVFASGPFLAGLWERDRFDRDFERDADEVALIVSGEADVTTEDGSVLRARPGDVLVTPAGSRGHWRSRSPLRKFWATYAP